MKKQISKADKYFIECLKEVRDNGEWDIDPRPKWSDGTLAHSKFITQKSFDYRIDKGELPLISLRPTAIKGGWYDMEAIYQKQTNVIEEMNPLIWKWWEPFVVSSELKDYEVGEEFINYPPETINIVRSVYPDFDPIKNKVVRIIGQTYGHTVKRYELINKLLMGMQHNPFGRRHIMNLWQEQQILEDPKALVPCAYETLYSISEYLTQSGKIRYIDMTLNQRSQDFLMTASINPMQYVMLGLAICGHLTYVTGIKHTLRNFKYNVQNLHIYDRHLFAIDELLEKAPQTKFPSISLDIVKGFYDYSFEDFKIDIPYKILPLSKPLELAV